MKDIARIISGDTVTRWDGGFGESVISRYHTSVEYRNGWWGKSEAMCPSPPTPKREISIRSCHFDRSDSEAEKSCSVSPGALDRVVPRDDGQRGIPSICLPSIIPSSTSAFKNFARNCHSLESPWSVGTIRSSRKVKIIFARMSLGISWKCIFICA